MHIAFIAIIAMKLTIRLKQFILNLWKFIVDFPWCNDQMHCTYVDHNIIVTSHAKTYNNGFPLNG